MHHQQASHAEGVSVNAPSMHRTNDGEVARLLQSACMLLVRAEHDILTALDNQLPSSASAASVFCKVTSLDLLGIHMRARSAKKLVKVSVLGVRASTNSHQGSPLQRASHNTRQAAKLQPSLPVGSAALVDYLPLSTMLFSPDYRVDKLQQHKLAESLSSVKQMRKAVQASLQMTRAPPHVAPGQQAAGSAAAA